MSKLNKISISLIIILIVALVGIGLYIYLKPSLRPVIPTVQAGEGYVPVNLPIRINFSHSKTEFQDIKNSFSIVPEVLGELFSDGKVLTLEHERNLKYDTEYTITIGNDFVLSFTTRPRGEKRVINLGSYTYFQSYTLNYYDHDYEVFISPETSGEHSIKVYKSNPEKMLQVYFSSSSEERDEMSFVEGGVIDSQVLTLNDEEDVFVPNISDPGIYYVEVDQSFSFFLILTKNAVTAKRLGDKLIVWVVDQKTSAGAAGARIKAMGDKKEDIIFQDTVDDHGLLKKIISQDSPGEKPHILEIKTRENDVSFSILDRGYGYDIYSEDYGNIIKQYKAYIYTDRPIYQPGDTVNFKVILRENDEVFYKPVQKEAFVKVQESGYGTIRNTIFEKKISSNQNGSLADVVELTREVKTGEYEIVVEIDNKEIASSEFNIEFYQKPDFEILLSTDKEEYIKSQPIQVDLSAAYFFGDPLKGEKISWRAYDYYDETISRGESLLDIAGKVSIEIPTKNASPPEWWWGSQAFSITIEASITDKSGKTSVKTKTVSVFDGEYKISLLEPENTWNLKSNKSYKFVVKAEENLSQKPKSNLPLKIILEKANKELEVLTDVSGRAGFELNFPTGGHYELEILTQDSFKNEIKQRFYFWISEQDVTSIQKNKKEFADKILVSLDKKSYKIGEKAKITLQLPRPVGEIFYSFNKQSFKGYEIEEINGYQKEIELKITEDLVPGFYFYANLFQDDIFVEEAQFIEVTGKKLEVEVVSSKLKAGPDEEIELSLKTKDENGNPVSAESSLSVIDKAIFALKSDQTADIYSAFYQKPEDWLITADSLRSISISPVEMGGCFLAGTKILMADGSFKNIEDIKVDDYVLTRESRFSNELVSDKVTEVFEHLSDEYLIITHQKGILRVNSIHPILVNDIWKSAGEIKIGDELLTNRNEYAEVISIKKTAANELLNIYNFRTEKYHTFFADGIYVHNQCAEKGGGEGECPVRSNFVDTAYWNAFVKTNKKGEAKIKFRLPDNLTTWVALSKAITKDTKAGQGKGEFKVSKDLIIRPALPKFFRNNDKIYLTSSIHNNLGKSADFKTLLEVEGATILDARTKDIHVANNEIKNVSWHIQVGQKKSAKLTFIVEEAGGGAKDGVELTIPVYSDLSLAREVISGAEASKFYFLFKPKASRAYSSATISITPSVLATFPEILEKLTGYPYGCIEQTMSKQLPNIFVYKEKSLLGIEPEEDFEKQLEEGFDRIAKHQNPDGSFGWWSGSSALISTHVLQGLYEAKQAGLLGKKEQIYDRLLEYLKSHVGTFSEEEKIYIDYVLSIIEPNLAKSYIEEFADRILAGEDFDIQSKGYIALALYYSDNILKAKAVLEKILEELNDDHWELPSDYGSMKDKYSATGVNLLALIKIDYHGETAQKIVQWLMNNRVGYNGLWGSTWQSAQIIFALIEYLKATDELNPNYVYEVYLNDQLLKEEQVKDAHYALKLNLPIEKMISANSIEIKRNGTGNIYWMLTLNNYLPSELITGGSDDLKITREYLDLDNKKITKFSVGDLIKVRLTVTNNQQYQYVILEDFLPGGFDPQNPRLENVNGRAQLGSGLFLGSWYDFLDIRDEKVVIFRRSLWPSVYDYNFEYLVRVSHRGDFEAPAPQVELMYSPEVFGFGKALKISAK